MVALGSYYSPHGGDGYSKGDLTMDSETSLGGLEDVLINQSGNSNAGGGEQNPTTLTVHHPNGGHHTIFGATPSMTPIDKLYSMQSSYFNSNDCECLVAPN